MGRKSRRRFESVKAIVKRVRRRIKALDHKPPTRRQIARAWALVEQYYARNDPWSARTLELLIWEAEAELEATDLEHNEEKKS
jgi:hypothetical protein